MLLTQEVFNLAIKKADPQALIGLVQAVCSSSNKKEEKENYLFTIKKYSDRIKDYPTKLKVYDSIAKGMTTVGMKDEGKNLNFTIKKMQDNLNSSMVNNGDYFWITTNTDRKYKRGNF
jgi:hypothetical protein